MSASSSTVHPTPGSRSETAASTRFREHYGPWALIAGASEGLGAAFARELAGRGLHLILLARRAPLLDELAAELRRDHAVEVRTAAVDLGAPDLGARVTAATRGLDVGLLVYNAAFSLIGDFLDQDLDSKLRVLDVNCRGPLILAHQLGKTMVARGRGGIVLMSSLAGTQGSPRVATYAATKAFNLVLGEGLWDELGAHGVDVVTCRAGATRTPNFVASKPRSGAAPVMEPAPVAVAALDALGRRPSVIPGFANRLAALLMERLLPRRAAIRIMGNATRKMYPATT